MATRSKDGIDALVDLIRTEIKDVVVEVPVTRSSGAIYTITLKSDDRIETKSSVRSLFQVNNIGAREEHHKSISSVDIFVVRIKAAMGGGTLKDVDVRIVFKPLGGDFRGIDYYNPALRALPRSKEVLANRIDSRGEAEALQTINQFIDREGHGKPVTLQIGNKAYQNIIGLVSGKAGQKADLVGINKDGKAVVFLSHKMGQGPTDFQQYSGISTRSGLHADKEVVAFKNDIQGMRGSKKLDDVAMHWKRIEHDDLKQRAVFGSDVRTGAQGGLNAIQFFAQGEPKLRVLNASKRGEKELTQARIEMMFSGKLVYRGDFAREIVGDYEPVLGARKGESHRVFDAELTPMLTGWRGGVWTMKYATTRKNREIVSTEPSKNPPKK